MWRSSPGHNAKLLNRNDTVGGIGQDGKWWTYRAASSIEVYRVGKLLLLIWQQTRAYLLHTDAF